MIDDDDDDDDADDDDCDDMILLIYCLKVVGAQRGSVLNFCSCSTGSRIRPASGSHRGTG